MSREERERSTLTEQIRQANELAAGFFVRSLQSPAGAGAREYLRKRGIGEAAIKAFRLGFAPDGWHHLLDFLEQAGYPAQTGGAGRSSRPERRGSRRAITTGFGGD